MDAKLKAKITKRLILQKWCGLDISKDASILPDVYESLDAEAQYIIPKLFDIGYSCYLSHVIADGGLYFAQIESPIYELYEAQNDNPAIALGEATLKLLALIEPELFKSEAIKKLWANG